MVQWPAQKKLSAPLLTVLCVLLCTAGGYWWFKNSQPTQSAPVTPPTIHLPSVSVIKTQIHPTAERLSVSGTLVARNPITISPELDSRRVTDVWVDVGQYVKKGQKLLALSTDNLQADVNRAIQQIAVQKAAQEEARANQEEAQLNLKRMQVLFDKGFSKKATLETAQAAARSATARYNAAMRGVNAAQAALQSTQALLTRAVIVAPADGMLANRQIFVGDTVRAGQTLFLLVQDNLIELQADVAESDLLRLQSQLPVEVKPASSNSTIQGTVRLVVPQIDERTRLAKLLISLPVHADLRVGGFASGDVILPATKALTVPITAVQSDSTRNIVLVVDANDTIVAKSVTLGRRIGNEVVIEQGLNEGENVVRTAGPFLATGMKVRPVASNTE